MEIAANPPLTDARPASDRAERGATNNLRAVVISTLRRLRLMSGSAGHEGLA